MMTLTIFSLLVLGFWLALAADRKRWWPSGRRLDFEPAPAVPRDVAVVVPARDEEAVVSECLPSLLAQSDAYALLVYVDDRSTDATGDLAREVVRASGGPGTARVIEGAPASPGWSGKLHALRHGVEVVLASERAEDVRWFLFTDADIRHAPGSIRALRAKAADGPWDLVSVMALLRAESFWERLLIPPFVYFFQLLYPFRRVSDPGSRCAAAAGGCVLISRALLEKLGGLAAIRHAVIDDVALAKEAKRSGGRLWLGLSRGIESLRRYEGFRDIGAMISRTAFTELRYSVALLALALGWLAGFFVSPPFLAAAAGLDGNRAALLAALAAWAIQSATLFPAVRHQRVAFPYALTLPVASAAYLWLTFVSAWNHWRGRGVRWKGRTMEMTKGSSVPGG